jgi:hypothetical protein
MFSLHSSAIWMSYFELLEEQMLFRVSIMASRSVTRVPSGMKKSEI